MSALVKTSNTSHVIGQDQRREEQQSQALQRKLLAAASLRIAAKVEERCPTTEPARCQLAK